MNKKIRMKQLIRKVKVKCPESLNINTLKYHQTKENYAGCQTSVIFFFNLSFMKIEFHRKLLNVYLYGNEYRRKRPKHTIWYDNKQLSKMWTERKTLDLMITVQHSPELRHQHSEPHLLLCTLTLKGKSWASWPKHPDNLKVCFSHQS